MKYELDIKTLNETVKCNENFACIEGEKKCLCNVDHMINGKLLFVNIVNNSICDYRTSFGYSHFCNCPVRMEIFERYNV
jgi:hypothetical protein